jgi:hypothetical protein
VTKGAFVSLTPAQRTLRARIAAESLHAQGKTNTAKARKGFMRRFEDQVDPDRKLPPSERAKRAEHALKAHMTRLALASARARGSAA